MEKEITTFITYLHNVKGTSKNTEMSYKRDLDKVRHFMAERGIHEVSAVSSQDLGDYVKYLEDNKFAAATVSRNIASLKAFYHYMLQVGCVAEDLSEQLKAPKIEKIQTIPTTDSTDPYSELTAACAMRMSPDTRYIYCTNAGDNVMSIFTRDEETGLLELLCSLPISGDYPKDVAIFPDQQHVASINHDTGDITFFKVDYEKGLLIMCARPVKVNEPNCCRIVKVAD